MQHIKAGRQNKERTVISDLIVCALFAVKKKKTNYAQFWAVK